ncbi:hypothetical protein L873DRAFT_1796611 [Choiromyces venosus 120613-1]|uniref:Uncharacterized protein n=1 Tax=Choiromyces venosus 120613-1 TaxID=1336337 RepID=A0A3N4IRZ5_9PEZI|nr:hypothetical protein L873DRAFT_1796611 [Choiromyces venosus 120613-1]
MSVKNILNEINKVLINPGIIVSQLDYYVNNSTLVNSIYHNLLNYYDLDFIVSFRKKLSKFNLPVPSAEKALAIVPVEEVDFINNFVEEDVYPIDVVKLDDVVDFYDPVEIDVIDDDPVPVEDVKLDDPVPESESEITSSEVPVVEDVPPVEIDDGPVPVLEEDSVDFDVPIDNGDIPIEIADEELYEIINQYDDSEHLENYHDED